MIPALDVFLARLFDVTTNEIGNIVKGFDFHEVSPNDVDFVLYKPDKDSVVFKYKNTSMFDPLKPTKFMIHGWQASGKDDANKQLAEKYHQHGDYNTIALDWSKHAKKVYMHSSSSTKDIGKAVGDFIVEMTKNNAKLLDNVHLIGHSLGGHVAGFAGQRVYEKTGKKVGRITGLDVAAPLFEIPTKRSADSRLSEDDAQFVDVIHTNAGFLGVSEPIGTADFYVENGGPIQSECIDPLNIFESRNNNFYFLFNLKINLLFQCTVVMVKPMNIIWNQLGEKNMKQYLAEILLITIFWLVMVIKK